LQNRNRTKTGSNWLLQNQNRTKTGSNWLLHNRNRLGFIKPTWIPLKRKEPANNGSLTPRQERVTRAQEGSLPKTPGPTNHANQTTALIHETKAQQRTVPVVLRN
jgi:hypothetical protein